jgi:hypothetical protein
MTAPTLLRSVRRIRVYSPIASATLASVAAGDVAAVASDPVAGPLLKFIESCPDCGNFGAYRGVAEVSIGVEAFTPVPGATPTTGRVGERCHSPTVAITTYVGAEVDSGRLAAIMDDLASLHPWEVPVIEVTVAELRVTDGHGRPGPKRVLNRP